MSLIDSILNKYTMYFIMLWSLRFLAGVSVVLSIFGLLPFSPISEIFSFCFLVAVCYTANQIFARLFKVPANKESYIITALILYLVLIPVDSFSSGVVFAIAGIVAMASKYFLTVNKRHIFNPAAFGLFVIGVMGSGQSLWWVGNKFMFPFVLIVGLLIIRKLRKFHLFLSFLLVSFVTTLSFALFNKADLVKLLPFVVLSYPILFLGTIMLTEPLTTPPTKKLQIIYGAIVGFFSGAQFNIGPIFSTPELALLIGNVFSFAVSFKRRLILIFESKKEIAPGIFEFLFKSQQKFAYNPGQYLEWTLGHKKPDKRGLRRYFTIASSPTEDLVHLGVRMDAPNQSSFKKALSGLKSGDRIFAGSLSGDFVLPKDKSQKLVFIAGGIGITPFRSMVKFLIDKKETRDITVFYACSKDSDFVFNDIFEKAHKNIGLKLIRITHRLDADQIKKEVPDFKTRRFYFSGPNAMVEGYKKLLGDLGVRRDKIITDYFPGY